MILIARPYSRATSKWQEARATLSGTALLAQLVEHLHGKEGVDGSSPSEGFASSLLISGPGQSFPVGITVAGSTISKTVRPCARG